MGVLEPANKDAAAQQGKTYIWFTTNDSRIKNFSGEGTVYWTRTWTKSPYRFYGVGPDGGYAFSGSPPDFGIRSYDSAGLIFGFCV